jgi:RNA polymerase sigma-70 factor (ECF subfamily)
MDRTTDAFIELLNPNYTAAVQYCIGLTRNKTEAKDLLQDSLLIGLQKFYTLKNTEKFKPWLFKIISRKFFEGRKKVIRLTLFERHANGESISFPTFLENETIDPKEELLLKALDLINNKERIALVLFEVGGFSIEEIMYLQKEKTLSAIKSRLSRAREKLKLIIESLEKQTYKQEGGIKHDFKSR